MAREKNKRKPRVKIAIVGDGQTEKIYFEQLKEEESIPDIDIKPDIPDKYGGYLSAIEKAKFLVESGYDFVFCLIDLDKVISDGKLKWLETETKKLERSGACKVLLCNPCFEIWFLLHHIPTTKLFRSYSELEKELHKHMASYTKEIKYLKSKNIYKLLKDKLPTEAIPNSVRLEKNQSDVSAHHPRCQVHVIFQRLFPKDERFNRTV
ncbi:RloB domain-containing protein [Pontibacter sp. JH31]|uniref:RloB domain-containing protein n=1 Tax=Pontibacter aquaedesilientis TaxID=2766980 RepID=A0ABR7XFL1_9BACT|nr:RloB family protein [Pontibacter aquaedesilientis]MBD1397087.1 RloB domain-containing protein [Pontibacter aquaedesilientis]